MESPVKVRGKGAPSRYSEEVLAAVVADLRAGAPRPNRYEIARKHDVGVAFVNYRWRLIRHEYETKEEAKGTGEAA